MNRTVQRERGQSAVMVSLLIMIVVMLIAFTTNLGKLVTEKIAMQNAIDLAVYSGAATQAGYLNRLRRINQRIWQKHQEIRAFLDVSETNWQRFVAQPPTLPPCTPCCGKDVYPGVLTSIEAEQKIMQTKQDLQQLFQEFRDLNRDAADATKEAVEDAADANYKGTRQYVQIKSPLKSGPGMVPVEQEDIQWSYKAWATVLPSPTCPSGPVGAKFVKETTEKSWFFRKNTRGEVMVAARIEGAAPNSPFLEGGYLGNYFSASCSFGGTPRGGRCPLNVAAAAAPYHGKLGSIHPGNGGTRTAETQWDSVTNFQPNTRVDFANDLMDHRVFGGAYYDYKVRYVGIFDSQMQFLGGTTVQQGIGQYGDKMEH